MKTSIVQSTGEHPARVIRGMASAKLAGSRGVRVTGDVGHDVEPVTQMDFVGGVINDLGDGVVQIAIGGTGTTGGTGTGSGVGSFVGTTIPMLNNSGSDLSAGSVVVVDAAADAAVTTTTTAGDTRIVGVTQAAIVAGAIGPVLFNGFSGGVITTGTITRGYYLETSTVAGAAQAVSARTAGTFAVVTAEADLTKFVRDSALTLGVSGTSLAIALPTAPVNRVLFLALWRDPTVVTTPTITGWTRIGSTSGFYYYYRVTTGGDTCTATWSTTSPSVAVVLLLDATVSVTSIVETQAFDATTAAAAIAGMSAANSRYALSAEQGEELTSAPSGWRLLLGGTYADLGASADQNLAHGTETAAAAGTGAAAPVNPTNANDGNSGTYCQFAAGGSGGTLPERWIVADLGASYTVTGFTTLSSESGGQGIFATIGNPTTQPGQYFRFKKSTDNITYTDVAVTRVSTDGNNPHLEVWSIDAGSIAARYWMAYAAGKDNLNLWGGINLYTWAITGAANATATGSLVGKYIAADAAVTSPFTGSTDQYDGVFAVNLTQPALPTALLYGPDLVHAGTPSSAPLLLEDGTIAILEDGSAAMGETTYS